MKERVLEARLLNRLRQAEGGIVTVSELIDALWGDAADGGPLNPANSLRVYAFRLRQDGYPVHADSPGYSRGYRFVPQYKEISEMPDTPGRVLTRGTKTKATDYLPPGESVRIARMIRSFEGQRNAAMSALAICEGQLAAKDFEIDALKRVIAELNVQREAAWAKPENMAGSETVVPG